MKERGLLLAGMPIFRQPFDPWPHDEGRNEVDHNGELDEKDEDRVTDLGLLGLRTRDRGEVIRYIKKGDYHSVRFTLGGLSCYSKC